MSPTSLSAHPFPLHVLPELRALSPCAPCDLSTESLACAGGCHFLSLYLKMDCWDLYKLWKHTLLGRPNNWEFPQPTYLLPLWTVERVWCKGRNSKFESLSLSVPLSSHWNNTWTKLWMWFPKCVACVLIITVLLISRPYIRQVTFGCWEEITFGGILLFA